MQLLKRAFLGGAAAMLVLLLAIAILSDTVQTSEAVRRKLDVKLFATIHHEEKNKTMRTKLKKANKGLLITMPVASFCFTEEVYKLGTKVDYAACHGERKVILVTSVAENEGKSTVAANLALSLTQGGRKVLLIDADLHKAAQYKLFQFKPSVELTDMLRGNAPYQPELLEKQHLYTLFSMKSSDGAAELIASPEMGRLLNRAREEMDYIVIDSPPMALFSDVEALADRADLSLLVVRQDVTPVRRINDTVDILNQCRAELLGCVFNDVRGLPFSNDHYGYGYGYGSRDGYGGYYGEKPKGGQITDRQSEGSHGRT